MIKAVCFDLDGTLVHYVGDFQKLLLENARSLAVAPHLLESFVQLTSGYTHSLATSLEITRQSLKKLNIQEPENLTQLCQQLSQRYAKDIELLEGALKLLEFLRGKDIPLAVITNGPADMQLASIHKIAIQHYFKAVVISGEYGIRKPDARIFKLACEKLEVAPEHCLMVGDTLHADIEGAKNIGMQTAWMSEEKQAGVLSFEDLRRLETWLRTELSPS
jgi:putative hydrolase of the HAD superfamily